MKAIFRFPGGKYRVAKKLAGVFSRSRRYIEPFAGGASVALAVAEINPSVQILLCDADPKIADFWIEISHSDRLAEEVLRYTPSVTDFYKRKEQIDPLSTLIVNRCSHSGRGNGPIGGNDQSGEWKIDARWNAIQLHNAIKEAHSLLRGRCSVFCGDSLSLSWDGDVFADPPYVDEGKDLYEHCFSLNDHIRLADKLNHHPGLWVLTYSDNDWVRQLYSRQSIIEHTVVGAVGSGGSKKRKELIIMNPTERDASLFLS